jgi:hypothetical protein
MNILSGIRIFIGVALLMFGCFLDFSWGGVGTSIRFISGIVGSFLILGNANYGLGYVAGMIIGIIGYSWAIRSGSLPVFDLFYVEGFGKYSLRVVFVFFFILGLKDVKEG